MSDIRNRKIAKPMPEWAEATKSLMRQHRTVQVSSIGLLIFAGGCVDVRHGTPHARAIGHFDGRTFAGWGGETNRTFRIEHGAIVGGSLTHSIPRNEFVCTTRFYTNFVLRLNCRLKGTKDVNGGVQFRSLRVPDDNEVAGYQAGSLSSLPTKFNARQISS